MPVKITKRRFTRLHFTSMQTDEPLAGSNISSFTIAGSTSADIHEVSKTEDADLLQVATPTL